jgi:N-acetylglucosamine-6-phosphate deacetylase
LVAGGFSIEEAVKTASFNPARIMHYTEPGAIIPGKLADITVFNNNFEIETVVIGGNIVKGMRD